MTNLRPIEWITAVLSKLDKLLEYSVSHSQTSLTSNQDVMLSSELESHKTCLVKISQTNCSIVINGLINSLQKLSAMRIYGARQEINLYASQIIVLDLLEKCISLKEFSIPNDSLIMKQLLTEICQLLNQPLNDKAVLTDLKASASKVLLCISQKNFLVVFNRISSRLHDLSLNSDDSSDLGDINLINHVQIDLGKIKILLEDIVQRFRYLKKSVQAAILTNLDKALWTWLSSYPDEIQLLYEPRLVEQRLNLDENSQQDIQSEIEKQKKLNDHISKCAEKLYDISVDGSRKKAVSFWPLHTMLLVFCPEILSQICSSEGNKSSKDLFEHLKKGLFSSGIRQENSVECYVRLLKTSTCFSQQNDEFNPLLSIVKDILPDLQNVLFLSNSKYFMKTNDQSILINCFVSSFRLFPNKENLAKLCASSSSSVQLKMVLVQSLNCISSEPCLDWWPNLDSLNKYGVDIRKIFQDCMIKHQASTHLSPRNRQTLLERMERKNVGMKRTETTYKDLLQVIVQLIQTDPQFFLRNSKTISKEHIHSSVLEFFMSLASLYSVHASTNQQSLSTDSLEALLRLHDPLIVSRWNPDAVLYSFWIVSSTVLNSIFEKLISQQLVSNVKITLNTLKWLHQVLINRVEFLSQNTGVNCEQSKSDSVKKFKLKLEMLILEQLWNSNSDIVMVAISCLQCLIDEHDLRITTYGSLPLSSTLHITNEMYREMVDCCSDIPIQEHVLSVFRKTNKFLPACLEAWEDTRAKWEDKTSQLLSVKQSKDDAVGEDVSKLEARKHINVVDVLDWVNMTGYLCSLGGVCMRSVQPISSSELSLNGEVRTNLTPNKNPAMTSNNKNPASHTHVSRFISRLLNLLGSFNIKALDINNSIRDLLAMSLHPSLYPSLFQQIKIFLTNNIFDTTGSQILLTRNNTQFIGYAVFILDKVFQHCSVNDVEYLAEESMEAMIIEIVRYVRHMGLTSQSIQLRIGFCRMIVSMMTRKHDFFFLSEIKFSNKVVDHITDWIMTLNTENIHFDDITLRDLDEHAVIAVGVLLNGLPLHPYEGDGGNVPYAKSHLFLKYFTLFMKLLGKCTDQIHERKYQTTNVYDTGAERTDSLRKSLILAMSNLLSANIEYGLVHSMSLSYHDDIQTRSAFLEVLTKILQQGSHGFDSLGESVSAERFEHLIELVTMMGDNGELPIANALANVVHTNYMDELARVFVTLFDAKHLLYQLLWNMFTKEVEEAKSVQTLFRGNSLASKIMTFCFKVYGASYLHNLVEPLVAWSLTPEISALQFDVDQKRLPPGVDILQCRLNLQRLTERFFTRIMTSTDKFPPQLKSVCHCLYQVVSQRFVESGNGAVASAIFLRFLNPAIATPYQGGLCDKPLPPNLARAFKFMCKIMQNIANHVEFTKEEHMKHFNEFVKARFDVCQQFFVQISTPECTSVDSVVNNTSYMNDTNVTALHRLLWNDQEKIGRYLAKSRSAKAVGRRPFDKMVTLLAYLGPPDYTRPVLETRYIIQNMMPCKFEELMTKRKATESEEFKLVKSLNIFFQFGRSKMGYPVFYYIARRYLRSDISEEILMFYILKALKPYTARKFDLIIDLTHVGAKNGFRSQYLPKWLVVYPPNIYKNLDSVYIYNPNTWVREYVKYNEAIFNEIACHPSIKFVEKLSEINNFIEKEHQNIPSATRDLDEDVSIYLNGYRSGHTKIHIKVGKKAVQICLADKIKFLGFEVILNNVYYSSEIESIELCDENNSFRLKESTNNSVMLFTHHESWKIAQEISHIRERWEIMEPQQNLSTRHKISAKDVPGTFLNMALLNLGCPKPLVRSCAYNLLCSLTSSFNLHLSGRLCESEGLCIPANNTLFIVSISKTLAKNERHLTLEFLEECIAGFQCSNNKLKTLCLEYMEPWLFNIPYFTQTNQVQRNKVKNVIKKLIDLTIQEKSFYPSIQTKVWANVGKMSPIIDIVLELFIEASEQGGLGSAKAEIMADTSVALSSSNMKLVSSKIISRLCCIIDKTCLRPTPSLEKHKHWDEIAILARYLLMLSFNNNLDVATHLPYLFHLVSLLLYTGPSSLKASVHGLVVNIIHSLLTCEQIAFTEETQQVLRLSLTEFCLPKFYCCFGISDVKYAADTAFKPQLSFSTSALVKQDHYQIPASPNANIDENSGVINLSYLDTVTDALLEVMEACIKDIPNCAWLLEWQELSRKFALQYNPSLQPRALVVFGCINKTTNLSCLKQILNIMGKSLECHADPTLLEASVLSLTRLQLTVNMNPELHCIFFWLGICVMGLNDQHLYYSGLSLIEQNLHHLDLLGAFSHKSFDTALMNCIAKVESYFINLEEALNVSFHSNFHYAFITHLIKGFRHTDNSVISCVIRVIEFVLELISRNKNCHKYEVNADSSPYLTALLCISPEVRHHCPPIKKQISSGQNSSNASTSKLSNGHLSANELESKVNSLSLDGQLSRNLHQPIPEETVVLPTSHNSTRGTKSLSTDGQVTPHKPKSNHADSDSSSSSFQTSRPKHSSLALNFLFDGDVLDYNSQILLLSLLATQVRHSATHKEVKVLYEYLAEASIAFPNVFPIIHGLLDHKINHVLNHCEDSSILNNVQLIVHNALLFANNEEEQKRKQLNHLQRIGFGGMWWFAGPFAKVASLENASIICQLIDSLTNTYLGEVPDLNTVRIADSSSCSDDDDDDDDDGTSSLEISDEECHKNIEHIVGTSGSFRNKGPKLTIKVPN